MSIERVREFLKQYNMEQRIIEFSCSSATVSLASKALGCECQRIAKSMSFYGNDNTILIVAAGDAKVSNAKYNAQFGFKAKMCAYDDVEKLIGHAVGGTCPFAVLPGVDVYLDKSLMRFSSVYPACGSENSAIELTIAELEQLSGYKQWIDVCTGWQEENNEN